MNKKTKVILVSVTLVAVVTTSIIVKLEFIRMLPLIFSLFIMLVQSEANRYGYIAGSLNSLLYGWVYYKLGLYASCASSALFSFPIQLLTFINWQKHSYKNSTTFKKMSNKTRIIATAVFVVIWLSVFTALTLAGSEYAVLDNSVSLLGIIVSVLTMLAYIEYSYLWLVSSALNIFLNTQVALNEPSYIPYVIYAVYNMWCVILAFINVRRLYKNQKKEGLV